MTFYDNHITVPPDVRNFDNVRQFFYGNLLNLVIRDRTLPIFLFGLKLFILTSPKSDKNIGIFEILIFYREGSKMLTDMSCFHT